MNDTYGGKIAFLIVSLGFLESSSALLLGGVLGSDVLLQVYYGDDLAVRNSMKSGKAIDDMIWVILMMNPFMTVKAT